MQFEPWTHGDGTTEHPQLWRYLHEGYQRICDELSQFQKLINNPPAEWRDSSLPIRQLTDQAARNALGVLNHNVGSVVASYRQHELEQHPECKDPIETVEAALDQARNYLRKFAPEQQTQSHSNGTACVNVIGRISPGARF